MIPLAPALWFLRDHPPPLPEHHAEWLDAGGAPVRVVRAGEGDTTLVLLHGFGESLTVWRPIFDRLTEKNRVVALDLPGFGGSAKPAASYSLESMTERLTGFLDRWVPGPVVMVGHSMGGELAASVALARPDQVKLLVLIAPAGYRIGLGAIMGTMSPTKARALGRYLALRSFITPIHAPAWLAEPDSMADYDLTLDSTYVRAATRVLEEFDWSGLRGRFQEIRQPTLLIWGGLDPVIPVAVADSIARELRCRRFISLPGAFHRPQAEVPETVFSAIRAFLASPGCE
ncbi:MAG: alpha/beta fold hydrolase [Gemmatimonadales bacterium]|nr:alpha/beta fold hydrolase [Gemmatimonadales bacterium]